MQPLVLLSPIIRQEGGHSQRGVGQRFLFICKDYIAKDPIKDVSSLFLHARLFNLHLDEVMAFIQGAVVDVCVSLVVIQLCNGPCLFLLVEDLIFLLFSLLSQLLRVERRSGRVGRG